MKRNKGFTLVELLVVMAIIAILAAIAIPNVQRWILRSRAVQAISEIENIELAMTKMLSDAGRSSMTDLLDEDVVLAGLGDREDWTQVNGEFDVAVERYTERIYRLLRKGRGALVSDDGLNTPELGYKNDIVRNLGTSYFAELGFDPWGNLYQIYPRKWRTADGPNVFRTYLPPATLDNVVPGDSSASFEGDDLSLGFESTSGYDVTDLETGEEIPIIGIPAGNQVEAYIWSNGANLESGQARYEAPPVGYNPTTDPSQYANITPVTDNYPGNQEPELMGGGDDINNWDRNQTFMRFYN